ncbi:MAG: hypothetical protein AAFX03_07950 [Pseudomonadota bacterium]
MSTDSAATPAARRAGLVEAIQVYRKPKMAMMLVLGFAAGLPFLLYYSALSVRLESSGLDVALIGFFSVFGLTYSLKFLWAPVVDRVKPWGLARAFGQRRSWIFVAQLGVALGLIGLSFTDPAQSLAPIALFTFLLTFSSATQDIGIDAWRIEAAAGDDEQAPLAAAYQLGYKVGMTVSGGVFLVIAGAATWPIAYLSMAGAMALAAFVFAIWDRRGGVQAAGAAGALVLSAAIAAAAAAFGDVAEAGSALWLFFEAIRYASLAAGAAATVAFLWFAGQALTDAAVEDAPRAGDFLQGAAFTLLFFAGVGAAASAIAYAVVQLLALFGVVPTRSGVAQTAAYVAATPFILLAFALPFIRRIKSDAPVLQHPTWGPFLDFFWRHGWAALLVMLFVSTYRLSDIVMGVMAKPAYSAMGYTPEAIGLVSGTYGPWIVMVGVVAAGVSAIQFGLVRSLVIGAVVSILGNVIFAWLVNQSADSLAPLFIAVTADNIAGGYAGTIFIAYMSTLVNRSFAGTQYAIFSSIWSLGPKLVALSSGVMVGAFGYSNFFLIAAALGLPAVLLSLIVDRMKPDRESVLSKRDAA